MSQLSIFNCSVFLHKKCLKPHKKKCRPTEPSSLSVGTSFINTGTVSSTDLLYLHTASTSARISTSFSDHSVPRLKAVVSRQPRKLITTVTASTSTRPYVPSLDQISAPNLTPPFSSVSDAALLSCPVSVSQTGSNPPHTRHASFNARNTLDTALLERELAESKARIALLDAELVDKNGRIKVLLAKVKILEEKENQSSYQNYFGHKPEQPYDVGHSSSRTDSGPFHHSNHNHCGHGNCMPLCHSWRSCIHDCPYQRPCQIGQFHPQGQTNSSSDQSVYLQHVEDLKNEFTSLKTLVLDNINKNSPVINPPLGQNPLRAPDTFMVCQPVPSSETVLSPRLTNSVIPEEFQASDMDTSVGSIESTILDDDALNLN